MVPYRVERYRSQLNVEQWVVVPTDQQREHARPATECEVALWKELQRERHVSFHAGNRERFLERVKGRGMER